ncbi:MAG: YciI family protein [Candidatus Hydrogenedentes bacterium]|nr:YciI family protein [Candidatus Hydrogenedentota bacterium]
MRFMCLAYEEEAIFHEMSQEDWHALREETLNYVQSLHDRGHLISTHPLQSATTAATVRVRHGVLSVADGPFAETKEQIGGFFLIEAKDFDEAVALAAQWPSARLGTIEVRPLEEGLSMETRYRAPD